MHECGILEKGRNRHARSMVRYSRLVLTKKDLVKLELQDLNPAHEGLTVILKDIYLKIFNMTIFKLTQI